MRFTSELPHNLGFIGDEWRAELGVGHFANIEADVELLVPKAGGDMRVLTRDVGPEVEELEGIAATLQLTDKHFRQAFDVPRDKATKHELTVRTGSGNATSVPDMVYQTFTNRTRNRLLKSQVHIDIARLSDMPNPHIPELLYTTVYGAQTQWFEGSNYLPTPPGDNPISFLALIASMHLFLRPRTLIQHPYTSDNDHLMTFTRHDAHRMPPIDLRKGPRFLFRDAVRIKKVEASSA